MNDHIEFEVCKPDANVMARAAEVQEALLRIKSDDLVGWI